MDGIGSLLKKLMVQVVGDTDDLQAAMEDGANSVESSSKAMSASLDKVGKKMREIGKGMSTYFTLPLLGVGAGAIAAASDVEEMEGKFTAVFQHLSDETRQWAQESGEAWNRSKFDIQEYAASFQDIFVPMGFAREEGAELSKTLTQLGIDLASFNNEAEPETMDALKSALIGNHETVRRYGVIIDEATLKQEGFNMGIDTSSRAMTNQEKIQARLNIILRSTADAQGDAARTSDSFANQLRGATASIQEMLAEIGDNLLPVATLVVSKIGEWAKSFANLDERTQTIVIIVGALVAAIGPLLIILGSMASGVTAIVTILPLMAAGVSAVGAAITASLGPLGLLVAAVGAAYGAYKLWEVSVDEAREAHQELFEVIDDANEQSNGTVAATAAQAREMRELAEATREALLAQQQKLKADLEAQIKKDTKATGTLGLTRNTQSREQRELKVALEETNKAIVDNMFHIGDLRVQEEGLVEATEKAAAAAKARASAEKAKAAAIAEANEKSRAAADAKKKEKEATKAAAKAAEAEIKAKQKVINTNRELLESSEKYISDQKKLAVAARISSDAFEVSKKKLELLQQGFTGTEEAAGRLAERLIAADLDLADAESHRDVVLSIEEEIAANEKLVEALNVSTHEYMVQEKILAMMRAGYKGTAAEARKLAEEYIGSVEKLQEAQEKAAEKEKESTKKKKDSVSELGSVFSDMFEDILSGDFDFDDMLKDLGSLFTQSLMKTFVTGPLEQLTQGLGSGLKGLFSGSGGLADLFGGLVGGGSGGGGLSSLFNGGGSGFLSGLAGAAGSLFAKKLFGGKDKELPEFEAPKAGDNAFASSFNFAPSTVVHLDARGATKDFQAEIYDKLNKQLDDRDKALAAKVDKQYVERTSRGHWRNG